MKSDVEIAQEAVILPIKEIASKIGLQEDDLELYGNNKAKISLQAIDRVKNNQKGKLILVTSINPTPAGEGKTTTMIGMAQAFNQLGKNAIVAMREPSLGPCFGIKGGAAGGGYSQVIPMEDINLHFTGDIHAISAANNLISAMLDNSIHQGNPLDIDICSIVWKRVVDLNDRALRKITCGLGGKMNGIPREDGFEISVASEIMAVLCLATDMDDLKQRISNIIVAYNRSGNKITVDDLGATGAVTILLKDAIKPNLVQTLEHTPVFVHGGPFANIAHGCNSVMATDLALHLSDYTLTEAGFGADLGAEKFFDIKCRQANLSPDACVVVVTVRAIKMHGGVTLDQLVDKNIEAIYKGFKNLEKHIQNIQQFGVPVMVAINQFPLDDQEEIELIQAKCKELNVPVAISKVYNEGGAGGKELVKKLISILEHQVSNFQPLYKLEESLEDKILMIAKKIYGASGVEFTPKAKRDILKLEQMQLDKLPICIAKTQYSLSDNPKLLGRPEHFHITINDLQVMAGAKFIVAISGNIMKMPGLPKNPAACNMDIDRFGKITGLF